jgi:integrase
MVKLRPYVVAVNHVPGCPRLESGQGGRKHGRRRCAPGCERVTDGWEVDLALRLPDGTPIRERVKAPVSGKSAALRWAQDREAHLIRTAGRRQERKARPRQVPTLEEFWPRFMEGYARANQEKPSSLYTRDWIWRVHLGPALGKSRLDVIDDEAIQRLKGKLGAYSPKTVNNILANLSKALKVAVEWKVMPAMPCRVRLLKTAKAVVDFYEPEEYRRLVDAAARRDPRALIVVLLGGDAGLRLGEIEGVEWTDVDFARALLKVQRSIYDGQATLPKGGKPRVVPLTTRLRDALQVHRHLKGSRVLYEDDGRPARREWLRWSLLRPAERLAGLPEKGRFHILRHTFCSRLAARNVPMLTIQELAGHASIETTMRYMHLSSAAPREGIRALEFGDSLETAPARGAVPSDSQ